jgi:tRNA-Thr(GGU) m(6)t(6)A37 methyltransferase TsaA
VFDASGEVHPDRPAEVRIGDCLVMVTAAGDREPFPGFLYVYVDDADSRYQRGLAAGAVSLEAPLDTPYGDRRAMIRDPFGNVFQVAHAQAQNGGGRRADPAAAGEGTSGSGPYEVRPIGTVESPLVDPAAAPKQGHEGSPDVWVQFRADVADGLGDLTVGSEVILLTWLDRARRDVLRVHPRDDPTRPETGVFSTRSPDRPNPIGLHPVQIAAIAGSRMLVRNLEALDGTPVLDVKPVLRSGDRALGP